MCVCVRREGGDVVNELNCLQIHKFKGHVN